jgi:hypothetical protein
VADGNLALSRVVVSGNGQCVMQWTNGVWNTWPTFSTPNAPTCDALFNLYAYYIINAATDEHDTTFHCQQARVPVPLWSRTSTHK